MKKGIKVKVCGLTREEDVCAALTQGADAFGFIAYKASPRVVTLEQAQALASLVPLAQRIVVDVEPELATIRAFQAAGFQNFQIHASLKACEAYLAEWASVIGRDNLWIAPRLPSGTPLPKMLGHYTTTVVLDTYSTKRAGGTGEVGDWEGFRKFQAAHTNLQFILAGGLTAENIKTALTESTACIVDVNSGVESVPGLKDPAKLAAFFEALK